MMLFTLMALSLSALPQPPAGTQPAALQLHNHSQRILQHQQDLLEVAESQHRANGEVEFEVAMQLSRVAAEAGDAVSVMSDLVSIEQRLSCAADRSAVGPTVVARLSYTVRRLDLLMKSVESHLSFAKSTGIAASANALLEALGESRALLAALLSAR
ncbi:MAG: hypothetical protein ACRD15_15235 [Vicinamibacterales bacterium]